MMHDADSGIILVECIVTQDNPNAIGFTFEKMDKTKPTPQEIVDALVEYLLYAEPDSFAPRLSAEVH